MSSFIPSYYTLCNMMLGANFMPCTVNSRGNLSAAETCGQVGRSAQEEAAAILSQESGGIAAATPKAGQGI